MNLRQVAPTAVHDDFLVKPLDLSVLLASVQRQLQLTWLYKREALAESPESASGGSAAQRHRGTAHR